MKTLLNSIAKNKFFLLIISAWLLTLFSLASKIVISEDEAYSLGTSSHTLIDVIRISYNFEGQPPAYFVLLAAWRSINSSIFFAKLFSILSIGVSALFFYYLVLLFSGKAFSKLVLLLYLFNPFTIWAALEIRAYAFLILLSTLSSFCFFKYFFEKKKKHLYFFIAVAAIGISTQYFFAFIIFTFALIILLFKGWMQFFKFCLHLLPVLLVLVPSLFFLTDQIAEHKSVALSSLQSVKQIFKAPQNLILSINNIPSIWLNRPIRVIFILFFFYALYRSYYRENLYSKRFSILVVALVSIFTLFCFGVSLTGISYDDRYMSIAFPFFILLFTIFKVFPTPVVHFFFISLLGINFVILVNKYRNPVNTYDYKSAATFIESIELPGEPLLFYRPAIVLPFNYYYNGINNVFPLPYPVNFNSSYLINIKDSIQLKTAFSKINSYSGSYILISDTTRTEGTLSMNRTIVNDYLANNYQITMDTLIFGNSQTKPLRIKRLKIKNFIR